MIMIMRPPTVAMLAALISACVCPSMVLGGGPYQVSNLLGDSNTIEFDGIGGLSGGGGCSRLLVNYPEEQQSQVLDYLFKPGFGASLHILKVEIGGDAQSTDGTEASHRHTEATRWFVMKEAKLRNPNIKLYALPWAWPGWLRQNGSSEVGKSNPLLDNTVATAEYVTDWIEGAKEVHNLTIDYVSVWNEMDSDLDAGGKVYVKQLRKSLNSRNLSGVKIVAFDGHSFSLITSKFKNDPEMQDAVFAVGAHYPGTHGPGSAALGKKGWSSEDYSQISSQPIGGMCWARVINRNFITGNLTASIAWNLVDSYFDGLAFSNKGLMRANKPWSGHYIVDSPIWSTAHTTQFTTPGWRYLPVGQGSGWLQRGGSYVSLMGSSDSGIERDFTMVIEKMNPDESHCEWEGVGNASAVVDEVATFKIEDISISALHIWKSNLSSLDPDDWFVNQGIVNVSDGSFSIPLQRSCIYTLTTVATGQKGANYSIPDDSKFFDVIKAPYIDSFDHYNVSREAAFFSDMSGSWEIVDSGNPSHNKVMQQMVPEPPIFGIRSEVRPISLIGEYLFGDTTIAIDFKLPSKNSSVYIGAQFTGLTDGPGVFIHVTTEGWDLSNKVSSIGTKYILSGKNVTASADTWHTLRLTIQGKLASSSLDGVAVFENVSASMGNGWAVIGTGGYDAGVQFDNIYLNATYGTAPSPGPPGPAPPNPGPPGPGPPKSPCKTPYKGQQVYNLPCSIGNEYTGWEGVGSGLISLKSSGSLCLGVKSGDIVLDDCANEFQWIYNDQTSKLTPAQDTEHCIDINMHTMPMHAELWKCNNNYDGGINERFTYDSGSGELISAMPGPAPGSFECLAVCL